jgi:hypothetical protein
MELIGSIVVLVALAAGAYLLWNKYGAKLEARVKALETTLEGRVAALEADIENLLHPATAAVADVKTEAKKA